MSIHRLIVLFIFIGEIAFCQTENKIPTISDIDKANGKIKIETYYPVDTTTYHKKIVYLDSTLKVTTRRSEYMYFLSQIISYEGREIPRLSKKRAIEFHLDSTVTIKKMEDGIEKQYILLINAQITFKRGFKLFDCTIENGNYTKVKKTNRDRTRTFYFSDFSGLCLKTNKTWPTHTIYRKDGSIDRIFYEMYHKQITYQFD